MKLKAKSDGAQARARRQRKKNQIREQREAQDRKSIPAQLLAADSRKKKTDAENFLSGTSVPEKAYELVEYLGANVPKLLCEEYKRSYVYAAWFNWLRPLEEWKPRGKGVATMLRSLWEHLFAKYSMPAWLWRAFDVRDGYESLPLLVFATQIAAGGSPFKLVQDGTLSIPLTRKMCHDLMTRTPTMGGSFLDAIREAQVLGQGGNRNLVAAWRATSAGINLHACIDEAFWNTVLLWFCANPMMPMSEVGPLTDFIRHRRTADPGFSMKGRGVVALQRAMQEWHGELARLKTVAKTKFTPSGIRAFDFDKSSEKNRSIWHMREILTSKDLAEEGRAMSHCVYSYAPSVSSGRISIWSLTQEDNTGHWRRLTVEVNNADKRIVQMRGRFNKPATIVDLNILSQWSAKNSLIGA